MSPADFKESDEAKGLLRPDDQGRRDRGLAEQGLRIRAAAMRWRSTHSSSPTWARRCRDTSSSALEAR